MPKRRGKADPGAALCALAFLTCVLLVAHYLIAGYGAYLDADMASELALASQLAKEGALVSTSWRYSTEVRALSTELVFAPLMALFPNDWRLVRTLGCLILLAMMAASAYAAARLMGARRRYALLMSGLTLCPCSAVYAQMIVIGAYYVPHAILTNLMTGLFAACLARVGTPKGARRGRLPAACAALAALSAAMGAQSVRYLLCAVLPAAGAGLWIYAFPEGDGEALARTRRDNRRALLALGVLLCGAVGYALGKRWQSGFHVGGGFANRRLTAITGADLLALAEDSLAWLLRIGGYQEGRLLLSARGLFCAASTLAPAAALLLTLRALRRARREGRVAARAGLLTLTVSFALTLWSFVFVEDLFLNRYWLPVMTLGAPALACALSLEGNPALRRGCALLLTCVTVGLCFGLTRDSMASPERGADDEALAQAVEDTGMTLGYATFWNANIVTELTDGRVEVVAMRIAQEDGGPACPALDVWLEAEENARENRPEEPVFLLLEPDEAERLGRFLSLCGAQGRPLPKGLTLYAVESQGRFFEAMRALAGADGAKGP